jgi:hypothetical protein
MARSRPAAATIPLGPKSPSGSSSRPGDGPRLRDGTGARRLPIWPCSAWGLPCPLRCRRGGALLPHRFTLTVRPQERPKGGLFSVALSFASPRPGVTRHAARYGVRTFLPDCSGRSRGPLEAKAIVSAVTKGVTQRLLTTPSPSSLPRNTASTPPRPRAASPPVLRFRSKFRRGSRTPEETGSLRRRCAPEQRALDLPSPR